MISFIDWMFKPIDLVWSIGFPLNIPLSALNIETGISFAPIQVLFYGVPVILALVAVKKLVLIA